MSRVYDFINTLFNDDESICFSDSVFGTTVFNSVSDLPPISQIQFVSINPLKEKRLDANVTAYRNILVEFDEVPLGKQLELIAEIPHSTVVYSGGKSYHAVISLDTPCKNRDEYDLLVRRIYDRIPQADRSAKNPSRFTRFPGYKRNTGAIQNLIYVGNRISNEMLEAWLGPDAAPEPSEPKLSYNRAHRILRGHTVYFLNFGAEKGHWNKELFLAALDLTRAGYSEFETFERLNKVTGHLDASDKRTIKSAISIAKKE